MSEDSPQLSVRERIDIATLPWSKIEEEPPFCATDLILMALLSEGCLTRKEICKWMVDNLGYYRKLAAEAFWGYNRAAGKLPAVHEVHLKLDKAFRQYDLPVHVVENMDVGCEGGVVELRYKAHAGAESMLSLPAQMNGPAFPFFRLPAELRNTIYELVFQYPRSGLYFASTCTTQPRTLSRDLDNDGEFGEPPQSNRKPRKELFLAKPVHEILEPLLTSKQFYKEAMPVFFQINTFYFPDYLIMAGTFQAMAPAHLEHIKSVNFTLPMATNTPSIAQDLVVLTRLPGLRKLCVRFDEVKWLNYGWSPDTVELHPAVNILRRLKFEQVDFVGCPRLEALLKARMLKTKQDDSKANESKMAEAKKTKKPRGKKAKKSHYNVVGWDPIGQS
ncbi:hypothetical protein LTR56_004716 [Elasticomyces elasticus]|nr:hypothetical protein LTR56_004716 [Elasticomyces elasticus]KAK3665571.1 hypothetical protein LTR22_003511 [Elasticomyces elasticus]KAK4930391.1 hypothetical protein LTR49_003132 [Elasticomyces elasticus]KAK5768882.1 hypothetical protein LTS12_000942 [Elasticomyces elasticus]